MGLWVKKPSLQRGESVLVCFAANRQQTALRQTGGKLFLTQQRLIFEPTNVDRLTGGYRWSVPRSEIAEVAAEAAQPSLPLLGLAARNRRRLRITLRNGDVELFVVIGPDRRIVELRGFLVATAAES